eukprot:m51a1_g10354 hypothetical protein (137) ;mRNA; r:17055-24242
MLCIVPFVAGKAYVRKAIHAKYGGQLRSGIAPTSQRPWVFLFGHLAAAGRHAGYSDGWTREGLISFSGQGQTGDMVMLRGNKAIRYHKDLGKRLLLFDMAKSVVFFIGEVDKDASGQSRTVLRFLLRPVAADKADV